MSFPFEHPYRSPTLRAKIVSAAFVPYVVGAIYHSWLLWTVLAGIQANIAGEAFDPSAVLAAATKADGLVWTLFLLRFGGGIAFLVWVHRVAANLGSFRWPGETPGMTVGSFFIPIVSLWMPFKSLVNIWNGSGSDAEREQIRTPALFVTWWVLWLVDNAITLFATFRKPSSPEESASQLQWMIAAHVGSVAALVAMFAVVWSITRRQEQRNSALPRAEVFT
jgi:hypothetical protein